MRLSAFIAKKYGVSRRYAKQVIARGGVSNGSVKIRKDMDIDETEISGYILEVEPKPPAVSDVTDADMIINKYNDVLFFYKPPFVHSERISPEDPFCMSDLVGKFPVMKLVSRLDYAVDGVLTAVKDNLAIKRMNKFYLAWVEGDFKNELDGLYTIDAHKRRKVRVTSGNAGEPMSFIPVKNGEDKTLVRVSIAKAARHQVRAVLAHLGHPILGDYIYNPKVSGMYNPSAYAVYNKQACTNGGRIYLHCSKVEINGYSAVSPLEDEFYNLF